MNFLGLQSVAYAGFSKGGPGNSENLRITNTRNLQPESVRLRAQNQVKTKKKRSSSKFSPFFGPKSGEDQKHRSSPTVCANKPSTQVNKSGAMP